jgi:hypothetical protein
VPSENRVTAKLQKRSRDRKPLSLPDRAAVRTIFWATAYRMW